MNPLHFNKNDQVNLAVSGTKNTILIKKKLKDLFSKLRQHKLYIDSKCTRKYNKYTPNMQY